MRSLRTATGYHKPLKKRGDPPGEIVPGSARTLGDECLTMLRIQWKRHRLRVNWGVGLDRVLNCLEAGRTAPRGSVSS